MVDLITTRASDQFVAVCTLKCADTHVYVILLPVVILYIALHIGPTLAVGLTLSLSNLPNVCSIVFLIPVMCILIKYEMLALNHLEM